MLDDLERKVKTSTVPPLTNNAQTTQPFLTPAQKMPGFGAPIQKFLHPNYSPEALAIINSPKIKENSMNAVMGVWGGGMEDVSKVAAQGAAKIIKGSVKNFRPKNIHPEDAKIMTEFIDGVRLKRNIPETLGTLAENLMKKFGVSMEQSQQKIANQFEDILSGAKKTKGTVVKINPKNVPIDWANPPKAKTYYHGGNLEKGVKEGLYLTPESKYAEQYAKGGKVYEYNIPKDIKLVSPKEYDSALEQFGYSTEKTAKYFSNKGFDAMKTGDGDLIVFKPEILNQSVKGQPRYTKGDGGLFTGSKANEIMKNLKNRAK